MELEDRPTRNNLRIDGIQETPNETCEDCKIKIQELIKNKMKINEHIEIDRCHRLSKKKQNRARTITKIPVFSSTKIFAKTRWK